METQIGCVTKKKKREQQLIEERNKKKKLDESEIEVKLDI